MAEIWFFVEHGPYKTWTRAIPPAGIRTVRDLVVYLQRGGRVESNWMEIPPRARLIPRVVGTGVLATLEVKP